MRDLEKCVVRLCKMVDEISPNYALRFAYCRFIGIDLTYNIRVVIGEDALRKSATQPTLNDRALPLHPIASRLRNQISDHTIESRETLINFQKLCCGVQRGALQREKLRSP